MDLTARLKSDPNDVEAMYALESSPDPEAVSMLVAATSVTDQRSPIALTLGRIAMKRPQVVAENRDAMALLVSLLGHKSQMVRAIAAYALGCTKSKKAIGPLRAVLDDKDAVVQENARKGLEQLGAAKP